MAQALNNPKPLLKYENAWNEVEKFHCSFNNISESTKHFQNILSFLGGLTIVSTTCKAFYARFRLLKRPEFNNETLFEIFFNHRSRVYLKLSKLIYEWNFQLKPQKSSFIKVTLFTVGQALKSYQIQLNHAFIYATEASHFQKIVDLGGDVNGFGAGGERVLELATKTKNAQLVKSLIEIQANPQIHGESLLNWTILNGCHDILSLLIQSRANVQSPSSTLLVAAAEHRNVVALRILLESKANVNQKTPLRMLNSLGHASFNGDRESVQLLINAQADVNLPNNDGDTPLPLAAFEKHEEVVQILLDSKANVHQVNNNGQTALITAAEAGNEKIVSSLLVAKSDPSVQCKKGYNCLMYAAGKGYLAATKVILTFDPRLVHSKEKEGNTPLILTALYNQVQTMQLLLDAKSPVSEPNNAGETALVISLKKQNAKAIELLLSQCNLGVDAKALAASLPLAFSISQQSNVTASAAGNSNKKGKSEEKKRG